MRSVTMACGDLMQQLISPSIIFILLLSMPSVAHAQSSPRSSPQPTLSHRLQSEAIAKLAADARQHGDAVRGAILFTQQNLSCTKCHQATVGKPVGPDLTQMDKSIDDAALVESLLNPSKVVRKGYESVSILTVDGDVIVGRIAEQNDKRVVIQASSGELPRVTLPRTEIEKIVANQTSAMPDNLVDALQNRQQFLDLVRYLMELAKSAEQTSTARHAAPEKQGPAAEQTAQNRTISQALQGLVLLAEFRCSACHADDATQSRLAVKQAPVLQRSVAHIHPEFLQRYLANPTSVHPSSTMPDMMTHLNADEREIAASEITHFLKSLVAKPSGQQTDDAESNDSQSDAPGRRLFETIGCIACHRPANDNADQGALLNKLPLDMVANKYVHDGLVAFLENPLASRPSGHMPQMALTHWEAVDLANYLIPRPSDERSSIAGRDGGASFQVDPTLAQRGKVRFEELGCQSCHQVDVRTDSSQLGTRPFSQLRIEQGCLSGERGRWPRFQLTSAQTNAIRAALRREPTRLPDNDEISIAMTAFRCFNCHQRDSLGGVTAERMSHFQTSDPNLGPQGRVPPSLTHVGAKLTGPWMRQVLVSARSVRPYVLTRMPQYGADNVAYLVDLFQKADRLPPWQSPKFNDLKEMQTAGHEMVGTGGLNCIACHTFQLKKSANMSAVDLTEMATRLKKDWFYHYMRDPQRLSPNTIMPSFWPGGRAMRTDILAGDSDMQIEALWQYLLDGRQARTPRGLISEPLHLLATDEAVMLRRSYPEIGKRGIGVGYPLRLNLAYDAQQMRLAMIWKGDFADVAGVWRSQGHGQVRPLGDQIIRFAPGPDLNDANTPQAAGQERPPKHQFGGYTLDEKRRPAFRYQFDGIDVEDYIVDVRDSDSDQALLRRTLKLTSASAGKELTFRAATGKQITQPAPGVFLVDGQLKVTIAKQSEAAVVARAKLKQLVIPIVTRKGVTTCTLEYRW